MPTETVYVDALAGQDVDVATAGQATSPYKTIQYALDQTADGALIRLYPAFYRESVTLRGDQLMGLNARPAATSVPGLTSAVLHGTVTLDGDCGRVDKVTFAAPDREPAPEWSAVYIVGGDNITIKDNVIDGHDAGDRPNGILTLTGAAIDGLWIEGNTFTNLWHGIYFNPGATAASPSADIVRNTIHATLSGAISLDHPGVVHIDQNTIRDNAGLGVWVDGWAAGSRVHRNSFSGNGDRAVVAAPGTSIPAKQNWWGSDLGPRTAPLAPADVMPSPMPTPTVTPVPGVSPTPDHTRPQREANREDVSGLSAAEYSPFCAAAGCPSAPVVLSGTITGTGGAGLNDAEVTVRLRAPSPVQDIKVTTSGGGVFSVKANVAWGATSPVTLDVVPKAPAAYESKTFTSLTSPPVPGVTDAPAQALGSYSLTPHGTLSVTVRDAAGPVNASVTAVPPGGGSVVFENKTAGLYELSRPAGGPYTVTVTPAAAPGAHYRSHDPFTMSVVAGQVTSRNVDVVRLWEISGTVEDQDGNAVTDATVTATGPEVLQCPLVSSQYVCRAPAGQYTVRAADGARHADETVVTVGNGANATNLSFVVIDAIVTGTVREVSDERSAPRAGVRVEASSPDHPTVTTTTAGDGSYAFSLASGAWSFKAEQDGYLDGREGPFDLPVGARQAVNLVLRPRATSTGGGSGSTSGSDSGEGTGAGGSGTGGAGVPGPAPLPSVAPQPGPDGSADAGQEQRAERVSGSDRNATAASLSASSYPDGAPIVFVASAGGFADALAGGPAAARRGGPVLLVDRDRLPESTRAEIERLGAANVVVLGGPGAVSPSVESQLRALGVDVDRLSGNDRFATAAAVSRQTFSAGADVAYVATGGGFADALSGGAAAAHLAGPVVLVESGAIPSVTGDELRRLRPGRIVVLGGSQAVSPAVEAKLREYSTGGVRRISGPNRYATSAAIAAEAFPDPVGTVFVATGENFPDALAGVPAAAKAAAPLLLVQRDDVPEPVAEQLRRLRPRRIVILGGEGAVSRETQRELGGYATE